MDFAAAFNALTGYPPFRWQKRLFNEHFTKGDLPAALDLPTGLGKTSVMAIWLIARALADAEAKRKLPRRLFYVVDRRAVVDQATAEAERLRAALEDAAPELKDNLGLAGKSLPISTLRGQFVDNREWLADPATPAIIVGTVDMVGSRLLFEGYGVSRKMRPYHAGLIGADALIVLDEAHLVPPFEKLIEAIEKGVAAHYAADRQRALGGREAAHRNIIPPFRLLSLSATGREREGQMFRLTDDDRKDEIVAKRLSAKKTISVKRLSSEKRLEGAGAVEEEQKADQPAGEKKKEKLEDALADAAWELSEKGQQPIRCLIYCDKRETAQKVFDAISKKSKPDKKGEEKNAEVELFTGARRFFEREDTARRLKDPLGFIAGENNRTGKPVFLVATSAAEVGVDLDADHMVCDLVAWERMVQRFGRVNRRGERDSKINVIDAGEPKSKKADEPTDAEKRSLLNYRSLTVIRELSKTNGGGFDASPEALLDLKRRAASDPDLKKAIDEATMPAPLRPPLNRALVDAWSMTSLEEHSGRPEISPWLRGWVEVDGPQTAVVWRTHLPVRTKGGEAGKKEKGGEAGKKEVEEFFEAAPPHVSEKLEIETWAIVDWLVKRAEAISKSGEATASAAVAAEVEAVEHDEKAVSNDKTSEAKVRPLQPDDIIAFALTPAHELKHQLRLQDLNKEEKRKEALQEILAGATLVLDARFGGLSCGLLDHKAADMPRTADDGSADGWLDQTKPGGASKPAVDFRMRCVKGEDDSNEVAVDHAAAGDRNWKFESRFALSLTPEGELIEELIVESWRGGEATEEGRSVARPQSLAEHQSWAEAKAKAIAAGVGLGSDYANALAIAARLHDEGKRARLWQRAFNANRADSAIDRPLAKAKGPIDFKLLDGYRHEFGSLPYAQDDPAFKALPADLQDLVLHLIAAHHGGARPIIETRGCEDAPPSALQARAAEVALRFARLQKQWGPWGLAWWEALLRAADAQASRENDEADRTKGNA